jgi:cell division septum initiation protein DivIVA
MSRRELEQRLFQLEEENKRLKEENAYLKFELEEFRSKRYKPGKNRLPIICPVHLAPRRKRAASLAI